MSGHTTRRNFLRATAAASGCLVMPGAGVAAAAEPSASEVNGARDPAATTPITVITQPISRDVNPRASTWGYITEILQRAGLFFDQMPPSRIPTLLDRTKPIVLLASLVLSHK